MFRRHVIWYSDFVYKGQRYFKSLNVTSKSVAKELEQKFKTEVRSGEFKKQQIERKRDVKFSQAIKEYYENESINLKSHKTNTEHGKWLLRYFSDKPLSAITPEGVTEYKMKRKAEIEARSRRIMEKKKLKAKTEAEKRLIGKKGKEEIPFSTANRELALLRRVFNWYKEQHRLTLDNPVTGVEFFRERERDRVMTEGEEERFFTKGNPLPVLRDMVILALSTGMRLGEILKLKKNDVVIGEIGGYISLKDTKNGDNRKIMLTKGLTEFLKQVISDYGFSEYVFTNPKTLKPYFEVKEQFRNACKRAEIEDLRFHDLRHTFCTRVAALGVNPFVIMQIVGHKDTKTAKRYINPTDEHLMAAMARFEKKSRQFSQPTQTENKLEEAETKKLQVNIAS
jgi:integrase